MIKAMQMRTYNGFQQLQKSNAVINQENQTPQGAQTDRETRDKTDGRTDGRTDGGKSGPAAAAAAAAAVLRPSPARLLAVRQS